LSIEGLVLIAFCASTLLTVFTRVHPAAYGCVVPFVAVAGLVIYMALGRPGTSTAVLMIPIAFFSTAIGSVGGAFAGAWLRQVKNRRR
jgi:uncharacterized membrane protein YfcA